MKKIEVNRQLLEKCIKDVDVADVGNNMGKLSIEFNDDASTEEIEAIEEFFNNMYSNLAAYLGISEEELTKICEKFEQIGDEIDEADAKKIVTDVLNGISNSDATLAKKLKELDNIPDPSNEELDEIEIENKNEDKIIDLCAYRKKR